LKLLTLNLWWGARHKTERFLAVKELIEAHEPDVIAFQELTADIFQALLKSLPKFRLWPPFPTPAGTVLMTRQDWVERGELKLTSFLQRRLTWMRTDEFTVATVHLESVSTNTEARIQQLAEVFGCLERFDNVVLVGDFNFAPDWEENRAIPLEYCDAWKVLHPGEPGYTEDTSINLMRLKAKGKEKQVRFDRVLCGPGVVPQKIELIGTDPIAGLDEVWPSDHFGLVCEVSFAQRSEQDTLMMLGQSCRQYDIVQTEQLGQAIACLSAGSDRDSPSLSYKASKVFINEDALFVARQEDSYLLAVADGHFGIDTSHALIRRMSNQAFPRNRDELVASVHALQEPVLPSGGGSTLTVAFVDLASGTVWGIYTGDSPAAVLQCDEYHGLTEENNDFVYFNNPVASSEWRTFEFQLEPGALFLMFSDGVNECNYRSPETSIQPEHINTLWKHSDHQPSKMADLLSQLALQGVAGHPGGQDNIALILLKRPS
jgi:tyrosyl-DNA phosphodiesterase 2